MAEAVLVPPTPCWNWDRCLNRDGYGIVAIHGKAKKVHRVMYELMVGKIPDGMLVCHRCDNARCINPDHLFLGTDADNAKDAAIKNRIHPKLTLWEVSEIRRLRMEGFMPKELSEMFNVSREHIRRIAKRERRTHV